MSDYRRYFIPNALVFITCVTWERTPWFAEKQNQDLFWETLKNVRILHPFQLLAYVLMPDHFHWIMKMPQNTPAFSIVLHSLKRNYTLNYKKLHAISASTPIWQDRYWDHVIRNELDLERHFDYIHWNPVKHGRVSAPELWEQSSYSFWLRKEYYQPGWGQLQPDTILGMGEE